MTPIDVLPLGYCEHPLPDSARGGCEALWTHWTVTGGTRCVLPDGRCDIILRFSTDGVRALGPIMPMISGPSPRWHAASFEPGVCFVGARLRPGYAPLVLDIAFPAMMNRVRRGADAVAVLPDLAGICKVGVSCGELANRLLEIVNSRFRRSPTDVQPRLRAAVDALHMSGGLIDVNDLAISQFVDTRTIRRDFNIGVGLNPKDFAKILQFQRALRLICRDGLDTVKAAVEAGYTDQSHMTRRFRELGGFTPARVPDIVLPELPL